MPPSNLKHPVWAHAEHSGHELLGGPDATTATLSVAYMPTAFVESSFEFMLPSAKDHSWKPLPAAKGKLLGSGKATLSNVPLFRAVRW